MPDWLQLGLSRPVMRRAIGVALVVGGILIAINHGDAILHGQINQDRVVKMILTVCVPYLVSTYSSVSTMLQMRAQRPC